MVRQNIPAIHHMEESMGTIKAHSMVVLLCAYIMAWIALDDNTLYQRGPHKTLVRIGMAARIAAPYIVLVVVYHLASNKSLRLQGRRDTETTMSAVLDMANFMILAILANFVLTTIAYVFTYTWTMEGVGEADEDYNMMDVVDMRKVRLGAPGKICSFSQESDGFGGFRDYGTLQTVPLGTGTAPLENIAGKLSWLLDVTLSSYDKESYEDTRKGQNVFKNFFAFLGDTWSWLADTIPGVNSALTLVPTALGILSVFKTGGMTVALMPSLIRMTVFFFIASAHTDTNVINAIRDPSKAACLQGVVARVLSGVLFAVPDRIFKSTLKSALPDPNVSYDFSYYAPAMEFLREKGGFCSPAAWQGYVQWIWARGSLPPALAQGNGMEKLVKEMEESRMAWPSAVYRTSIMAAYNKLKVFHGSRPNPQLDLQDPEISMVYKFISKFETGARKSMLKLAMTRSFYEDPKNFPDGAAGVRKFKELQHDYVSRQLRRARDLFKLPNVRAHYVDLKKLGLDMENTKIEFPRLVARGETHLSDELIQDALFSYAEPSPEDKDADFLEFEEAMKRGQRRVMRVTTFLANSGTENRISNDGSTVCGTIFPGPPAFTEDRQYRFNGQSGLFTLLPVLSVDQGQEGEKGSIFSTFQYWVGWKRYVPTNSGRWSDDMGMYI